MATLSLHVSPMVMEKEVRIVPPPPDMDRKEGAGFPSHM